MEDLPISEYIAQIKKARANLPNMTEEEKLNSLIEFTRIKYRLIYKQKKREVQQKFKEPGERPFEKKVVRLAYYRHIKNLYQRELKRVNRQHEDSPELFRRFCKFRTDWLRAKGKKQATLKYLGFFERKTP